MTWTPREAAFVSESDVKTVQRAVDGGVVGKQIRIMRGRKTRVLGRPDLLFFGVLRGQEEILTSTGRHKLYEAVQQVRGGKATFGAFEVDLQDVDRQLEQRLAELERIRSFVSESECGDPVLKGTDIPVHLVAALAKSMDVHEAIRAYPSLSQTTVETACAYATVYPKKGRPFPGSSLKRMLEELALPDEVFGESQEGSGLREVYP